MIDVLVVTVSGKRDNPKNIDNVLIRLSDSSSLGKGFSSNTDGADDQNALNKSEAM